MQFWIPYSGKTIELNGCVLWEVTKGLAANVDKHSSTKLSLGPQFRCVLKHVPKFMQGGVLCTHMLKFLVTLTRKEINSLVSKSHCWFVYYILSILYFLIILWIWRREAVARVALILFISSVQNNNLHNCVLMGTVYSKNT